MRGHRFLGKSLRSLAGMVALGRVVAFRESGRPDPAADDHLGSIRGERRDLRGPRASTLHTEWFPPAEPSRGTLVFTHGLCLTEAVWHYQKRDLAGGAHGLVTWDLPGHGHSDRIAPGELTQHMAIDALARVVDEYEDPAGMVLVGHSLGGVATLGYLAHHPETARKKVRGVVLVSTPIQQFAHAVAGRWPGAGIEARVLGRAVQYLIESDAIDRRLAQDVGSEADTLSYRVVRVGFGTSCSPSQVRFVRDVIASVPPQVRVDAFRAMTSYEVEPHLDSVTHPSLVVVGEQDRLVNPEESKELARRLDRSETLILPEVGHAAFLEVPNTFNAAVLGFAERHLRTRPEADSA